MTNLPEWDHRGEVERSDSGANSERRLVGDEVHVLRNARRHLAKQNVGVRAAVLNNLKQVLLLETLGEQVMRGILES